MTLYLQFTLQQNGEAEQYSLMLVQPDSIKSV